MPVITPTNGSSGGGGSRSTATATVTTDPNTFIGTHDFDLGGVAALYWRALVTSVVGDGETFGNGPADLLVDQEVFGGGGYFSRNGVTFNSVYGLDPPGYIEDVVYDGTPGSGAFAKTQTTPRYLRISLGIIDQAFSVYSGPNHPTATFDITVQYLST